MDFHIADHATEARRPGLAQARAYSLKQVAKLTKAVRAIELPATIRCVGICGSFARLEAFEGSDCDLLVVSDAASAETSQAVETIYAELQARGFAVPKPGGVFRSPCLVDRLLDEKVRGIVDDCPTVFGQRIQLLLDAQPLLHREPFNAVQRQVLEWYRQSDRPEPWHPPGGWCFELLWQDVFRYWYSIRARAIGSFRDNPTEHQEVNLKLRSSRLLIIAGMLSVLAATRRQCRTANAGAIDGNRRCHCIEHIIPRLKLTPCARLAAVVSEQSCGHWSEVLDSLEEIICWLHGSGDRESCLSEPDRNADAPAAPWQAAARLESAVRQMLMEAAEFWSVDERREFLL